MTDSDDWEREDWERLVRVLDEWTSASAIAEGRIRVLVPDGSGSRWAVIVMTQNEWDQTVGTMWGDFDAAAEDVKQTLLTLGPREDFAVYRQYRLWPSAEEALPETLK